MTTIQPIDSLIKAGLSQKMTEQFRAPTFFTTSPDKLKALQTLLGNKPVQYPYIFLSIQSLGHNVDGYNSRRLARYGIPVQISEDQKLMESARIFPANFEIEASFVTNKYSGDLDAVEGFARRWQFVRRNGWLQFTVGYGLTSVDISPILADAVSTPPRENPAEQESVYQVVANMVVKGYVSEPELAQRQRIIEVVSTTALPAPVAPASATPGTQFFPFP